MSFIDIGSIRLSIPFWMSFGSLHFSWILFYLFHLNCHMLIKIFQYFLIILLVYVKTVVMSPLLFLKSLQDIWFCPKCPLKHWNTVKGSWNVVLSKTSMSIFEPYQMVLHICSYPKRPHVRKHVWVPRAHNGSLYFVYKINTLKMPSCFIGPIIVL